MCNPNFWHWVILSLAKVLKEHTDEYMFGEFPTILRLCVHYTHKYISIYLILLLTKGRVVDHSVSRPLLYFEKRKNSD